MFFGRLTRRPSRANDLARVGGIAAALLLASFGSQTAYAQCSSPANAIVAENCLPGNSPDEWAISGVGDDTIQGFATDISVNVGQTIDFKVKTPASAYHLDIYRMGYYGGMGARKVATVNPSATLPQTQPACLTDASTNLYDCGNWAISASWAVPSNAVSGIYFAHLVRNDTGGDSHIFFIVRNDSSHSAILYQTTDETWQAYNDYGGHSLYGGDGTWDLNDRAYKVSYNRPFDTRQFEAASWVFNAEYPMVRWLEANGYDVTYFTGIDAARSGSLIKNHKVYVVSGHDEYVSGPQRANVESAREAGVNMAFFTGNEYFWKTRWENSIDGSGDAYRTMACYKETYTGTKLDPADPPTWTGTWRDPRLSPPADGGRPENALTGTLFMVNGPGEDNVGLSIKVPAADGKMRFWRNTSIANLAPDQTATLAAGTLGYEWDADVDNGYRPAGLIPLSTSTYTLTTDLLLDYGAIYGAGAATHHLSLYRAASGALVFGAGTVQWSWGLDENHDAQFSPAPAPDVRMQQATVNLFADMGVQPASIQAGLSPATQSTDTAPPTSIVVSPAPGAIVTSGSLVTITGTASDSGGGVVGAVEVSVDGGQTWHPTTGRNQWSFGWKPATIGTVSVLSRAVDDSGNLEHKTSGISYTVAARDCPCTLWSSSVTPVETASDDGNSVEVGVSFQTDYDGFITGIRFYKGAGNIGTHIGHLWSSSGQLLGTVTFTGESNSGWQQANFSTPVPVSAGTTYVASYLAPEGHYSADTGYFTASGVENPPVHAPNTPNGVYAYGSGTSFPANTFNSTNYWVDVVFIPGESMPGGTSSLLAAPMSLSFVAMQGEGQSSPAPQAIDIFNQGSQVIPWTATSSASWLKLSATSGTTPASVSVSVNTSGLSGTYSGTITITPPSGYGSVQVIPVTLTVNNALLLSNFDDSSIEGWAVSPLGHAANWSVVNQALNYNGGGHTQLFAGSSAWTDYDVQMGIKLSTLSDYPAGFRGRVNPVSGASYAVWLYPAEKIVRLFRVGQWNIDAGYAQLGQASVALDNQSFHTFRLSFLGSQIQVSYDGASIIKATDATYASGMIALDVSSQPITYDNIVVTSAQAVSGASLTLSSTSLAFSANYQAANPAPQTVQIGTSGTGSLAWTAVSTVPWLNVSASSGATPATIQVSTLSSTLSAGSYTGAIRVTSLGAVNSPQIINVSLNVVPRASAIAVAPSSMNFVATNGTNPGVQNVSITDSTGTGSFAWTATTSAGWLHISSVSGSAPSTAGIGVDLTGLAQGTYSGTVTISAQGVANSPVVVPVNLTITSGESMAETFSDQAVGWIISPMGLGSGWTVSNGVYSFSGTGLSQSCAGNAAWSDYTFDTSIRLSNLNNWPGGVRGRVNPSTGAGYAVWLYPGSGRAILYRVGQWDINGQGLTSLAQASLSFDTSAFHDLQMAFTGNQVTVYWDGALLMSATDNAYTSGFVCMDADSQPIAYKNVRVTGTQGPVTLSVPSNDLTFSSLGGSVPAGQTINVSAGGATTTWGASTSASWLKATVSSSLTPGTATISANASGLSPGTYSGSVTISAPGASNSPVTIPVTFAVKSALLAVQPSSLTFFAESSVNPPGQTLTVTNVGTGTLNWIASADSPWINLSASSGTAPASITVSPNVTGLATGHYSGSVSVNSPDVSNGPPAASVSLQVGTLLFADDFSSGTAGNWIISPLGNGAGWSVAKGAYSYNGQGATESWAGVDSWTDYTVAADFQLSSLNDYPGGLRGRVNTATGASYGVWIYPHEGILKLYRINQWFIDAGFSLLAQSQQLPFDATNRHNLRLSFIGSQIQVYYDNALVIQASDSTYTKGAIALDVSNRPIAFTNVKVIGF
jgi:hypothetical protein